VALVFDAVRFPFTADGVKRDVGFVELAPDVNPVGFQNPAAVRDQRFQAAG